MNWRTNLICGACLLVAAPAVVALQTLPWKHKYEVETGTGGQVVTAAPGRPARLSGMEWTLKSVAEGAPEEPHIRPLPPRTTVAVVVVSVKPLTPEAGKWFEGDENGPARTCAISVLDRAGRTWTGSTRTDLIPKSGHAGSCFVPGAKSGLEPLPVGRERTIQKEFIVPRDVFKELTVEVRTENPAGRVLLAR